MRGAVVNGRADASAGAEEFAELAAVLRAAVAKAELPVRSVEAGRTAEIDSVGIGLAKIDSEVTGS